MAEILAVPLKKPSDVDIVKPLKNLITSTYSTADSPEDYTEAINELSKLRSNAIWKTFDKYESSLEVVYRYYDQICALETKVPPSEVQIPFKWKDAFDKGSIFGGRISLTLSSLSYEKVCVLFNIAALQSSIAQAQNVDSDDGLKLSAKLLQQSSGIFLHLKGSVMAAIHQEPTPDLNPETLGALSSLMLAQAQEIFVLKAIHDKMKPVIIAKLSAQCEDLYADVLKQLQKELLKPLWDREWIPAIASKQAAYRGLTEYFQSCVCNANKNIGEEISRLQHAEELLKAAQTRSGRPSYFQDYVGKVQRALAEAKKDNDFIYHERIPDAAGLNPVGKAQLAKSLPLPERLSQNFQDLFETLVPVTVHQALAAYDLRKGELVNGEIAKLREASQMLNGVLASLNLPAALEDVSGAQLPQSVLDKATAVQQVGGLTALTKMTEELPELLQRNRDILDEAERLLREEQESDMQLRAQFRERWTRTPSEKLTETFRANAQKYREILNNAVQADAVVRGKFETHKRGMELLSQGTAALHSAVPSSGQSSSPSRESGAVRQLKALMHQVESMKAERESIESELKSATLDMKQSFLGALAQDGGINETAMSVENLGQVYGPLQRRAKENLERQEALLAEIQTANTEFCSEKSGAGAAAQREEVLKELASAHDAFMELQVNLVEGTRFYNDLTQLLVTFQNKVTDFCFARKTEKDELMKDLTSNLASHAMGTTPAPAAPQHHTDSRKLPPPRPPPPGVPASTTAPAAPVQATAAAGSLPYPTMQPYGMPTPYAPPSSAPYPTYAPMPMGYNPYATYPPPQHQNYGYPQPGSVPPQYPAYPAYPQQPPPQQNPPHW